MLWPRVPRAINRSNACRALTTFPESAGAETTSTRTCVPSGREGGVPCHFNCPCSTTASNFPSFLCWCHYSLSRFDRLPPVFQINSQKPPPPE